MSTNERPSIRDLLKKAKRPPTDVPPFDPAAAPDEPLDLFVAWLTEAVEGDVVQPQAMTLSSASASGDVAARTLLLKDVDDAVWFASSSLSPKGRQMNQNPRVALTLYWREQGRQVRIVGEASPGPREVSVRDFTARHPDSRAVAIAMRQSDPIESDDQAKALLEQARDRIEQDDDFAPDDWKAYRVAPTSVEFWQATTGRDQVRLRYDRAADGWTTTRLWP